MDSGSKAAFARRLNFPKEAHMRCPEPTGCFFRYLGTDPRYRK
jgi:hypothetical protein